jgi:hypothetical protein
MCERAIFALDGGELSCGKGADMAAWIAEPLDLRSVRGLSW